MFSKGQLLISEPFLNDPNFIRSVIILSEHGSKGSVGFVLNQTADLTLEDISDEFEGLEFPVLLGGPVEHNTIHFIHTLGDKIEQSTHLVHNIYWGGNFEQTIQLLRLELIKPDEIRFFLGYSGWGKDQLEEEYRQKSWIHIENFEDDLFSLELKSMWRVILRNQGGKLKEISNYPLDPSLN